MPKGPKGTKSAKRTSRNKLNVTSGSSRLTGRKASYTATGKTGVKEAAKTERTRLKTERDIEVARANRSRSRSRAAAATGVAANTDVALDADVVSGGIAPRDDGRGPSDTGNTNNSSQSGPQSDEDSHGQTHTKRIREDR